MLKCGKRIIGLTKITYNKQKMLVHRRTLHIKDVSETSMLYEYLTEQPIMFLLKQNFAFQISIYLGYNSLRLTKKCSLSITQEIYST